MYILGYSGLHNYINYKRKAIPDLSYYESLVGQGMDSAAAIYHNGSIIAVAEERFSKKKHTGDFPVNAINACLKEAGISINDVSLICHSFNYTPYERLLRINSHTSDLYSKILCEQSKMENFVQYYNMDREYVKEIYQSFEHHLSHAAYAYYSSGYDRSLILVVDGMGEFSSISVFQGQGKQITLIGEYGPKSSLGMLYSAITEYLGFISNIDEYKVMGLAAYGDKKIYSSLFDDIVSWNDMDFELDHLIPNIITCPADRETYRFIKKWLSSVLPFEERKANEVIGIQHKDLAAALQDFLNKTMLHLVNIWLQKTGEKNLCLSGGVALNCVANAYIAEKCIKEKGVLSQLYIPPAAGDDGTAIGAALLGAKRKEIFVGVSAKEMPFYGPYVTDVDLALLKYNLSYTKLESKKELKKVMAQMIANNKIVAFASGRMEFGPRALGNRSIFANPSKYEMRERLNNVTKQREKFRPFAPIVKEEMLKKYFDCVDGVCYKHMLVNARIKEAYREMLKAVEHIDGSARIQTINRIEHPFIWELLNEVEQYIGIPILLNTSFNLKEMPIVCSADDAINALVNSDIDALILNDVVVVRK